MNLRRWLATLLLISMLSLLAACIVERRPDNSTLIYIPPPGAPASGAIPELALATALTRVPMTTTAPITATATMTGTTVLTTTPTATTPISGTLTPKPTATGTLIATAATPRSTATRIGTPIATRRSTLTPRTATPRATATRGATVARTPTPTRKPTATATRRPTATSATPRPTPTSIPDTVFLGRNQGFADGSDYYVVGEVLNGSVYPVFNVKVIGSFYDVNNNIVAAQEVTTFFVRIEQELSSPFKMQVSNAGGAIERYELTLVWDDISIVDYEELIIERGEFDDEAGEIFGDLRNEGSVSVQGMIVAVTLYSDEGEIMDVYLGRTDQEILAAGESTTYTIAIPTGIEFERFEVQAQGALKLF